ncbi:bifunctional UDP-N-acetylglucosamine diphosphorylase/glucosamine-1-phosphate N-acetyltransferase GlmU [Candidatus Halobeggiatoa sp. HSG11]|nr:bifunctional UDP-N-acetylglucosamine diphosphorylase/glucosamine-1-phosphate N-acetyltransferase GlmU [Candidatus Halobeggiatoa sp. HSG11]
MKLSIIILAAGQGKRMHSDLPKVLHCLAGKPLLQRVIETAITLSPETIQVVYGHGGEQVRDGLADLPVQWIKQDQQLGTGHAVAQAIPNVADDNMVLILYGDVPLINPTNLQTLCSEQNSLNVLTAKLDNPTGYGRIVRDNKDQMIRIVEEKDADIKIKAIKEINTGILATQAGYLRTWLTNLNNDNSQGEYYLTDIIAMAVTDNIPIHTDTVSDVHEIMGVNNRQQLASLERYYQLQQANNLMLAGVTVQDPNRLDIRGTVQTGYDVNIDINVILAGKVSLGNRVKIGPNTIIRNAKIADDVEILSNCVIEDVVIGAGCKIGPFARLRPETELAEQVHIGNFVEIKKSSVAKGSKINHLSYIGDSEIGRNVNIGAGTITCNYDGANKHKTVIKDDVFIGSDTQLVAPVIIENGATIGAGSTVTKNVGEGTLTVSRVEQKSFKGWERPRKKK